MTTPKQHPAMNSESRKRATKPPLSRPNSPNVGNPASGAQIGAQGVDAIRARAEAATPGPWVSREIARADWIGFDEPAGFFRLYERRSWATPADDAFVAHARTDIPLLLAALDESRAEVAELRTQLLIARESLNAEVVEAEARATAAEAVVASVRELADEWEVRAGRGIGTLSDAVVDLRALLPTPTTTETGDES